MINKNKGRAKKNKAPLCQNTPQPPIRFKPCKALIHQAIWARPFIIAPIH